MEKNIISTEAKIEEVMKNNFRLGSKSSKLYNKLDDEGLTTGHFYKGVE